MLARKKGKNGNGNGNGKNGKPFLFKIGYCPICKKDNVPLTEHHLFKRAVFGNNQIIFYACRDCHDIIEEVIREMENSILRAFVGCYRRVNKILIRQGRRPSPSELTEIILQGFAKIDGYSQNPWLKRRIETKAVSLREARRKNEQ